MGLRLAGWIERWDRQQEVYLPQRETRFGVMADTLDALIAAGRLRADFTVVDLACGPAALAGRLLARFGRARAVGIELDPVTLALGQEQLAGFEGRLSLVEGSITSPGWLQTLGVDDIDVFVSTTALHWLAPAELSVLFDDLAGALRPGGVVLNGDNLGFAPALPTFTTITRVLDERHQRSAVEAGAEDWPTWWAAVAADDVLGPLARRREALFGASEGDDATRPPLALYEDGLRRAGFAEVGCIWQRFDDRVLLALR